MWKFLKYWTGLSLMANMPFILPFAGVLHSLFGDNRERPLPKPVKPKAPLKEFTTRTEPGPEINWTRVYRRIRGQTVELANAKARAAVVPNNKAQLPHPKHAPRATQPSRVREENHQAGKSRRNGWQR
jgi:hypothetical protein